MYEHGCTQGAGRQWVLTAEAVPRGVGVGGGLDTCTSFLLVIVWIIRSSQGKAFSPALRDHGGLKEHIVFYTRESAHV